MVGIRRVLAMGVLLGGTGCASLQHGGVTQAPPEHDHAMANATATIDPFHPPVESTGSRMSRFFPGLARHERSSPAIVDSLRKGGAKSSSTDSDLRAVPRPEVNFDFNGDDTTALPSRGSRSGARTRPTRTQPDPLQRVTSAERPDDRDRQIDDEAPMLQASMVAEVDPADSEPEIVIEPPRTREQLEARIAAAALSPRRTGPRPELSSDTRRLLPPRDLPVAETREQPSPEDRQTRQARVRDDENLNRDGVKPLLAVTQILPDADQPASSPPPMDAPIVADEPAIVEPTAPADQVADAAPAEPVGVPIADGPPPIEEPSVPADQIADAASSEPVGDPIASVPPAIEETPVTERDQVEPPPQVEQEPRDEPVATDRRPIRNLAGRPRLALAARRNDLPPDVPGPMFPRSYYGKDPLPQDKFPIDEQTEPGRWTWRPRFLKRLRGE